MSMWVCCVLRPCHVRKLGHVPLFTNKRKSAKRKSGAEEMRGPKRRGEKSREENRSQQKKIEIACLLVVAVDEMCQFDLDCG